VVGFGSEKQSKNLVAEGSMDVTLIGCEHFRVRGSSVRRYAQPLHKIGALNRVVCRDCLSSGDNFACSKTQMRSALLQTIDSILVFYAVHRKYPIDAHVGSAMFLASDNKKHL
jgi:hypothetical protein